MGRKGGETLMGWFFDPVQKDTLGDAVKAVRAGKASPYQDEAVKRAASQAGGGVFSAARAALEESARKGKK